MDNILPAQSSAKIPDVILGLVIPYKSPIDKVATAGALDMILDPRIEKVEFWTHDDCPPEQFDVWYNFGVLPIDIAKYHRTGYGSAFEATVDALNIDLGPGGKELLRLLNENNRTGNLKHAPYAIPHILREMYELSDEEAHHLRIISEGMMVTQTFIKAYELGAVELRAMPDKLAALYTRVNSDKPFTVGRFIRDLWMLGELDENAIIQCAMFWIEGKEKVQLEIEKGQAEFKAMEKNLKKFGAGVHRGVVLHTDNVFVTRAAVSAKSDDKHPTYPIRIIKKSNGQVSITTNQLNLSAVAAELMRREGSRWYHQEKMGTLHNGSVQYIGVKPTSFSVEELIGMLQNSPPPPVKRKEGYHKK